VSTTSTVAAPAPALDAECALRRAPGVLWREGAFGVVLLVPPGRDPRTLTGTGRALWRAVEEPITPRALAQRLAASFVTDANRVASDIAPVLAELLELGALERVTSR
jgi:hypothetical protein